ncbi:MAG: RagB/SusD family nutrient uptake outer membrane protein [Tannerellaceae bacterium]|nr:RagB/SusD family nutrient uptake outer membrane protein [Tannerellaceae bacterium]
MYRKNNQNRTSGNTEGIWVIQFETNLPGGGSSTSDVKAAGNYQLERQHGPMVRDVKINGESPFLWPIGDYTGGRGIGWAPSTRYFSNTIWESDFNNDIRNANHNFVREFPVTDPAFKEKYGIETISTENPPAGMISGMGNSTEVPGRFFYAYQTKGTTPYNHPDEVYDNPAIYSLKSTAGVTFTDQYMFRLAETYLLRAEAYLMLNDKANAAIDINTVRTRSHATPITAGDVTLDYILDERMRELGIEEKRRLTLMRTGALYDRVMKCNPYYANAATNGD